MDTPKTGGVRFVASSKETCKLKRTSDHHIAVIIEALECRALLSAAFASTSLDTTAKASAQHLVASVNASAAHSHVKIGQVATPISQAAPGLTGTYYQGKNFQTQVALRTDSNVDFNWRKALPLSLNGPFSAHWTGQIVPLYSQKYSFTIRAYYGVRLWIGDQLIINDWGHIGPRVRTGKVMLQAGQSYDVKLEYDDTSRRHAFVRWIWSSASQKRQIVPANVLETSVPGVGSSPGGDSGGSTGTGPTVGSGNGDGSGGSTGTGPTVGSGNGGGSGGSTGTGQTGGTGPSAPTATFGVSDSSPTLAWFDVVYQDSVPLQASTINSSDVTVTGPNGQILPVSTADAPTDDGTSFQVVYSVTPPAGTWAPTDNGTYTVALNAAVTDENNNTAQPQTALGTFDISVPGLAATFGSPVFTPNSIELPVTYTDTVPIAASSINASNVTITGPEGQVIPAATVNGAPSQDGTSVAVTYVIDAPHGTLSSNDNGTYIVAINPTVTDEDNIPIAAQQNLGSFTVDIPGVKAVFGQTLSTSSHALFDVDYTDSAAINADTISPSDLTVIGPNGQLLPASVVNMPAQNGTSYSIIYSVDAPNGAWSAADDGAYTVDLTSAVTDANGDTSAATSAFGSFAITASPTVQFGAPSETVDESAGTFSISVTQSAISATDTTIPFTLGGTAVSGTDYSGVTSSPLVIPAGQASGTITGSLLSDPGNSGTLTLSLGTPTNATLGATSATTLSISQPPAAKSATTTTLTKSTTTVAGFGQSITFTATVAPAAGAGAGPTGTVIFEENGAVLGTGALSGGVATFTTDSLPANIYSIKAFYGGDTHFNASTSHSLRQTVNLVTGTKSTTTIAPYGQTITFTATILASQGTPTGTITFMDSGAVLGTGTLSGGVATFSTNSLGVGVHWIQASYGGDAHFNTGTSVSLRQTIRQAQTTTALTKSTTGTAAFGQSVTFTATVATVATGALAPSGTVTFMDNGSVLGTGSLAGGIATFSSSSLPVGVNSIKAVYGGDATFNTSTSHPLRQTVKSPPHSV